MSEIRPNDIDEANVLGRTTIPPRAKLAGEGDGHECPSYENCGLFFWAVFPSLKDF